MRIKTGILAVTVIAALTMPIKNTHAQDYDVNETRTCGIPETYDLDTNSSIGHCDIYQRQIAYRAEALKLKEQLRERQENFAAPRREALRRYEQDMEALNESRGSEFDDE